LLRKLIRDNESLPVRVCTFSDFKDLINEKQIEIFRLLVKNNIDFYKFSELNHILLSNLVNWGNADVELLKLTVKYIKCSKKYDVDLSKIGCDCDNEPWVSTVIYVFKSLHYRREFEKASVIFKLLPYAYKKKFVFYFINWRIYTFCARSSL
jgi:hypothetical protein